MEVYSPAKIPTCFAQYLRLWQDPYGLPAGLEGCSNMILRHAQRPAQGQCFGISQTTNRKTVNPLGICSIFCHFFSHVPQQGILNAAVWANTVSVRKISHI